MVTRKQGALPAFVAFVAPPAPHLGRTAYNGRHRGRSGPPRRRATLAPCRTRTTSASSPSPAVEDLLRAFLPGEVLAELDFSTLRKLPAEYVSDELLQRHGDCVWRLRQRGRWLYLLVLLEFQSTDEPRMALRILTYTSLLYQELVRNDHWMRAADSSSCSSTAAGFCFLNRPG